MAAQLPDPAKLPDHDPDPHDRARRFLESCRRGLETVAGDAKASEGLGALSAALERAEPRPVEPTWLPVLDSIELLDRGAGRRGRTGAGPDDLIDGFVDLAPHLPWTPTHRATDGGVELALAPFDRVFDLGATTIGLMYVGPGATYPLHQHPPQELYLTIAGEGRWRYGGNEDFEPIGPNRTLYNHPGDLHSATAGPVPVVALYLLW